MYTEVKKHFKLMLIALKYNLTKEMENRTSFFMQIVFMMLNNSMFLVQWVIIFTVTPSIGGYEIKDIVFLWAIGAGSYGLAHIFFENVYNLSHLINTGKLDVYLTQPKNVLFNMAISKTNAAALGDVFYAYLLVFFIKISLFQMAVFTLFIITGALIMASFFVVYSSAAFWWQRSEMFANNMDYVLVISASYPEGIFKGLYKWLLYTLIPTAFIVFVPLKFLQTFNLIDLILTLALSIFWVMLAYFVFNKGLKKYSSSNLTSVRV